MKIKRFLSFLMSVLIMLTAVNVGYAEDKSIADSNTEIEIPDDILSGSSVDENASKNNENITEDDNVIDDIVDTDVEDLHSKSDTDIAYAVEGGNIYFDEKTGTITDCDENVTSVVIPNTINEVSVTSIGCYAFYCCYSLASITIPDSITSIDYNAFWRCSSLTSVEIPSSVTSIGDHAFSDCSSLTSIKIPNSVTSIGWAVFSDSNGLKTAGPIGGGYNIEFGWIDTIPSKAFYGCSGLTSVVIPESITSIGSNAFYWCSGLKTAGPIGGGYDYEFGWTDKIPNYAFSSCYGLTSIEIPSSVTSIGEYAFNDCISLTSIKIPSSVTSIGYRAFYSCTSLTSLEIPSSVTSIRIETFCGCNNLISIKIPSSVTSIGNSAFSFCSNLVSIEIPSSVTSIGRDAFKYCDNLTIYCQPNSYAETYAKKNNIPYSTEGYFDYTLTEADIPADVGDGIRFEKKVYEYTDDYFFIKNTPYAADLKNFLKNENMINQVTLSFSNEGIINTESSASNGFRIDLENTGYRWQAIHKAMLLKNGETIVTATLPNGDSSSCLVRVKCYDMGYDVKTDYTKPTSANIKTSLDYDNTLVYRNKQFNKESIPFKLSIQNYKDISHEYTEEELNNLAIRNVTVDVKLPAGLSFDKNDAGNKNKTIVILPEIPVGEGTTVEFEVYPTEPAAKLLSVEINLKSDNFSNDYYAKIVLDSDEYLYYDVSTPEFKGFIYNGAYSQMMPEDNLICELNEYRDSVLQYEDYTIQRLNKIREINIKDSKNKLYNGIRSLIDQNLVVNYDRSWTEEQKNAVSMALYEFISQEAQKRIDLGEIDINADIISIEAGLINKIKDNIRNETLTYTVGNYDVSFSITGFGSAFYGNKIVLTDRLTNKAIGGEGNFNSSASKTAAVMSEYVNELKDMGIATVNEGIISAIDFFGDTVGINKYLKDKFMKNFTDIIAPALRNKNLDELATFVDDCSKSYKIINKLNINDLSKSRSLIDDLINLDFGSSPKISERAAEAAYNKVIDARNSMISAATSYLYGVPQDTSEFKRYLKSIGIMCPVDVIVYDSNNNELGSIIDDEISCNSDIIEIDRSGDLKLIRLLKDEDIHLKFIANDYGTLNVTVEDYNQENVAVGRTNFYDIPLNIDEEFTSVIGNNNESITINSSDAVYKPSEYISSGESAGVTINANCENGSVTGTGIYVKGDPVVLVAVPIDDYKFIGWYNGDDFLSNKVLYEFTAKENLNLKALFEPVESGEEDTETSTETTTTTVTETSTETTTITTQTTTETTTTTLTETTTETTTTYTVSFDSNGSSDVDSITVVGGNKIDELPVPVREGYVFKGWYKDDYTFEVPFTSDDIVDSNLRLYAKWNRLITLTFDSNGGSAVESIQVEEGATTVLPKNTTKKGCTFGGWYLDELWSEEYTDTTEAPSYDRTLHAKWTKTLPSESEIRARYNSLDMSSVSNKYTQTPKTTAPYSTGKLSEQFVNQGLNYLNFIRYIEGLQDVEIDNSKVDTAQHGAVLLAALGGGLSHNPSKPSDMNEDFYNLGYETASSSNLSAGTSSLVGSLQGQLDDEDSSNIAVVGHRRWLTHPYMKYTAFGFAENNNSIYRSYSNVWVSDYSNEDVDFYDFIAYPAKGNFPSDLISNTIPWSVSLNTALYKVDSVNNINVRITKKSTGKTWNISQADHKANPSTGSKYFNYDDLGYGIDSCIIFSIGQANISNSELNGEFDVEITGLKNKNGNDTSINYTVNLFDLSTSGSSSSSGGSTSGGGSSGGGSSSGGSSGGGGGGGGGGSSATYYTISFDSNGGNAVDSKKVILNSKLTRPSEPVRKGYVFTGWYTDKACTKPYDFKNKVTKSFTLYAGWKAVDNTEIEKENEEEETQKIENINAISNAVRVTIGSNLVTVGNIKYAMDVTPYIQPESSSTLVPLRFAAIAISGGDIENADNSSTVGWDADTKTASITAGGKVIKFTAGSELMYIGNTPIVMENGVKAEIKDGRMFIPFRALGTALGVNVDWDAETKTAIYSVK